MSNPFTLVSSLSQDKNHIFMFTIPQSQTPVKIPLLLGFHLGLAALQCMTGFTPKGHSFLMPTIPHSTTTNTTGIRKLTCFLSKGRPESAFPMTNPPMPQRQSMILNSLSKIYGLSFLSMKNSQSWRTKPFIWVENSMQEWLSLYFLKWSFNITAIPMCLFGVVSTLKGFYLKTLALWETNVIPTSSFPATQLNTCETTTSLPLRNSKSINPNAG